MLKRTLLFTNPCRLTLKDRQIVIELIEHAEVTTAPIEDIGFLVLENQKIIITLPLLDEMIQNNVAVIFCDSTHYPASMLLNLNGHHLQQEIFRHQIEAGAPLKKNLWKQTVEAKIRNQAALLKYIGKEYKHVAYFSGNVKSGDSDNREGAAARIYWPVLFGDDFSRQRFGPPPNNMLNYGYAILRAAVARALAGSGLLATLGIHHHNRYNAFCLADDIMEPYRPFVDGLVFQLYEQFGCSGDLTSDLKMRLFEILSVDVGFKKIKRPLMIGLSMTTASLAKCYAGQSAKIEYPTLFS